MKIAVAGKGGVGKTFVASTLARLLARDGYNVLAVDADPNLNLAMGLGVPHEVADMIVPLSDDQALVRERTGASSDEAYSPIFNMTPRVNDIVDRFGVEAPDGVKLLVMGTVKGGGTGCMCGANALLRVLLQHLLIQRGEVLVMDMEAGLEHLGRGTARRMDAMLVVLEPRMKSVDTIRHIMRLAGEIEVREVLAVGNKVARPKDREFIQRQMEGLGVPVVAIIPYDEAVTDADMAGTPTMDHAPGSEAVRAVSGLKDYLVERFKP